MTTENYITCYEINGKEAIVGSPKLKVSNVNRSEVIELSFGGQTVTVHKLALIRAAENSANLPQ